MCNFLLIILTFVAFVFSRIIECVVLEYVVISWIKILKQNLIGFFKIVFDQIYNAKTMWIVWISTHETNIITALIVILAKTILLYIVSLTNSWCNRDVVKFTTHPNTYMDDLMYVMYIYQNMTSNNVFSTSHEINDSGWNQMCSNLCFIFHFFFVEKIIQKNKRCKQII